MSDQGEECGQTKNVEKTLSSAELRQRRREKILANKGSRMDRILGTATASKSKAILEDDLDWEQISRPVERILETEVDGGVTILRKKIDKEVAGTSKQATKAIQKTQEEDTTRDEIPKTIGFMVQQADGSTIHPKLSLGACRSLIFLLGIFLSIFNAKYFLVTFFSWEVAVFSINGLPVEQSSFNSVILVAALLGIKEKQISVLKFILKLLDCVLTDFSILVVSVLISRVLFENFLILYK